jgi:hypothetical protein
MIRENRTLIEITVCSELIELMKAQGKPAVPLLSRSEQTNVFMVDLGHLLEWREASGIANRYNEAGVPLSPLPHR